MALTSPAEVFRGWRTPSTDDTDNATALIAAAEAWIKDPARRPDIADNDPVGKVVVIEVVRAALAVSPDFAGHTAYSDTMGPWARSGTLATPAGTLHFTQIHEQMLGISSSPMPSGSFGDPVGYRYPPPGAVMP